MNQACGPWRVFAPSVYYENEAFNDNIHVA